MSTKKGSAKSRLLDYFKKHVGQVIDRDTLAQVAAVHDWQRTIRSLRSDDGWDIETLKNGYRLNSLTPSKTSTKREPINRKLRYAVLHRDKSTCQRCGRTPKDGVKLHIDHKIPVDMGGKSDIDNLWVLCEDCNLGKKNLFIDEDSEKMKIVLAKKSGYQRLKTYIELTPNKVLEPEKLQIISNVRDWTRSLRKIRQEYSMDIQWIKPTDEYPNGGYIYKKEQ